MTQRFFSLLLDLDGDGGGSTAANVDGSSVQKVFKLDGIDGWRLECARILVQIKDTGTIDAAAYGNGITLTNGIGVQHKTGGHTIDLLDGAPIMVNADWGRVCYDLNVMTFGSGDNYLGVRWTFNKSGVPIILRSPADSLRVTINDDLTGLTGQTFCVQGKAISTSRGAHTDRLQGAVD